MGSYYVQHAGQQYGPLTREELQHYYDEGALHAEDWAIEAGGAEWEPLGGLVETVAVIPEEFRAQTEIQVQFDDSPATEKPEEILQIEAADVSTMRKRVALVVLLVGLLGGGTALGIYLWPKSAAPEVAQAEPAPPAPPQSKHQPKPKRQPVIPPPLASLPLAFTGTNKFHATQSAASSGDSLAQLHMAFRANEGWGRGRNRALAVQHAEAAALSPDNHTARLFLGYLLVSGKAPPEKVAKAGDYESDASIDAVTQAADAGNADAQYVLGVRHLPRRAAPGVPGYRGDRREAIRRLEQAADQGQVPAQFLLGELAVGRSPGFAAQWFGAAAGQGHSEALRLLGRLYFSGRGVAMNTNEAVRLTRESARLGNGQSRLRMGMLHGKGAMVKQDEVEACKWFLLAAPAEPAARPHAHRLFSKLEPEQFAEAVELAQAVEPGLEIPEFIPLPPRPVKPAVASVGVPESIAPNIPPEPGDSDAAEAMEAMLKGLREGRAEVVWEALPASFQQEFHEVMKLAGQRLDPELHASALEVLGGLKTVLKEKKGFIMAALEMAEDAPVAKLDEGWDSILRILDALSTSELADQEWLESPGGKKFFTGSASRILAEVNKLFAVLKETEGDWEAFTTAKCELAKTAEGNVAVKLVSAEGAVVVPMQQVGGKWLPEEFVKAWKAGVILARNGLQPPAEGEPDWQKDFLVILAQWKMTLDNLAQTETEAEFIERLGTAAPDLFSADKPEPTPKP